MAYKSNTTQRTGLWINDGRVGVVTAAQEKECRTGPHRRVINMVEPRAWTLKNNNSTLLITFP